MLQIGCLIFKKLYIYEQPTEKKNINHDVNHKNNQILMKVLVN